MFVVYFKNARAKLFESLGFDDCCRGGRSLAEACAQRGLDLDTVVEVLGVERLRRELPRLAETLATVTRGHGPSEPELHDLARVFDRLQHELETHLDREEQVLFPGGETLLVLRDLGRGHDRVAARCGTHRALIDGLRALERDLHQHIHEENNVLFPRVRGLLAA